MTCSHHYLLGQPKGGLVIGVCKHCKAIKEHRPSAESFREAGHPQEYAAIRDVLQEKRAQTMPWED